MGAQIAGDRARGACVPGWDGELSSLHPLVVDTLAPPVIPQLSKAGRSLWEMERSAELCGNALEMFMAAFSQDEGSPGLPVTNSRVGFPWVQRQEVIHHV